MTESIVIALGILHGQESISDLVAEELEPIQPTIDAINESK